MPKDCAVPQASAKMSPGGWTMDVPLETPAADPAATPNKLTRITQVALVLNAVLHGIASVGMAFGIGPHAAEQPNLGRRAAAAGIAAIVMFIAVARRLRRDPALIALPLAFVLCNLTATVFEFVANRDPSDLAPAIPEATFLLIYSLFAFTRPVAAAPAQSPPAR